MKISVIGAGYVGLTQAACMAKKGHEVICADKDESKINLLKKSIIPFYEKGLDAIVKKYKNLKFTVDIKAAIENSDIVFCCVWTPPDKNFKPDIKAVFDVAGKFGKYLNSEKIFIIKSTVPVGTNKKCKKIVEVELKKRNKKFNFSVVSNPEFLRQGTALKDTINPDRVVIGVENAKAKKILNKIFSNTKNIVYTTPQTAELIKYAANSFLAVKISFINEISNFARKKNCNIRDLEKALKLDKRIGPDYLSSGIGYGGSCLRKDIKGLIKQGEEEGYSFNILKSAEDLNEGQKLLPYRNLKKKLGNLSNKKICLLGVAFKPGTDSVNEAPSIKIAKKLLDEKAKIIFYDPLAGNNFLKLFKGFKSVQKADTAKEAVTNADAVLICSNWPEFKKLHLKNLILDAKS